MVFVPPKKHGRPVPGVPGPFPVRPGPPGRESRRGFVPDGEGANAVLLGGQPGRSIEETAVLLGSREYVNSPARCGFYMWAGGG